MPRYVKEGLMDQRINVLVTGAGALLGQGILRCIQMAERPVRIITADPDPRATGHWLGHCACLIPPASDPQYLEAIENIAEEEEISLIFVGTDVELGIFSRGKDNLFRKFHALTVVSPLKAIEIANDKILTSRFLRDEGFSFVDCALASDRENVERLVEKFGFPLFGKPRIGARSVGAFKIADRGVLEEVCAKNPDYFIGEYLSEEDGEFTAGCLVTNGRCKSIVVLRRDLRDGNTYRAYAETSGRFDRLLGQVAERLGIFGPCNLQFRLRNAEPVIFEINARFSGTTPIRAIFGYNEVSHLLDYLIEGKEIPRAVIRNGSVYRAWCDIFVDDEQASDLKKNRKLVQPRCEWYPFSFENRSLLQKNMQSFECI
jgi:carbamoyl-phosphate synthase large subunit